MGKQTHTFSDITSEQAFKRLRLAGVQGSINIERTEWDWDKERGGEISIRFTVWLANTKKRFEADTLESALSNALKHLAPAQGDNELAAYVGVTSLQFA